MGRLSRPATSLRIVALLALAVSVAGAGVDPGSRLPSRGPQTQVVVTLATPSLASGGTPDAIAAEQRTFVRALRSIPDATPRWRYRIVQNGLAVVLPRASLGALRALPGVTGVYGNTRYRGALDRSPGRIAADQVWGPAFETSGQGLKIGIIDDGIDQRHPFFAPAGYTMPPGFPKGQKAFTTAKVIVARAFPPPAPAWRHAGKPFDPEQSGHGTHVAGIAAGNRNTPGPRDRQLSGVAPRAYLGNYKALTIPTDAGVGLDGNAPELVAAIEAAVADGMDVINLSLGEAEIEPSADIVARALDGAAAAGVVPVVAAGNDFGEFGLGSVASPGSSAEAITVAAVSNSSSPVLASFSSAGPTPVSLRAKPDLAAPGGGILSSVPDGWSEFSGTSMAAPHVAGAVALLRQRHPEWTVRQVKGALVGTSRPLADTVTGRPQRSGAGVTDLARADAPLLSASPASVSFGLLGVGEQRLVDVVLDDLGSGPDPWTVTVDIPTLPAGVTIAPPPEAVVPGVLTVVASVSASTTADVSGAIVLTRGGDTRRIPFWLGLTARRLETAVSTPLAKPGLHEGTTADGQAIVDRYRYPDAPGRRLAGPEQVFRVTLARRAANFGVVVVSRGPGVTVEPRVVAAGDESRLTGYAALPLNLNPYLVGYGSPVLAAGAISPRPGKYDVVFDSRTPGGAGSFRFRFWIDDTKPPTVRPVVLQPRRGAPIRFRVSDAQSGLDPASLAVTVDDRPRTARVTGSALTVPTIGLGRGRHRLRVQISDYQETRNMENVGRILPNTRIWEGSVVVR